MTQRAPTGPPPLRTLAVLGLLAAGCSALPAENPLLGSWRLDVTALHETEIYRRASEAERRGMRETHESGRVELTFSAQEASLGIGMFGKFREDRVRYRIIENRDGEITLRIERPDEPAEDGRVTIAGDILILHLEDSNRPEAKTEFVVLRRHRME